VTADAVRNNSSDWSGSLLDYNAKAERMGWLPSAPQFDANPIEWGNRIHAAGGDPATVIADAWKAGDLKPAALDPDNPVNWPRNMFFWRSNVLGASGKGHEYFLKHLVGSMHGVIGTDEESAGLERPKDVVWREDAPVGTPQSAGVISERLFQYFTAERSNPHHYLDVIARR